MLDRLEDFDFAMRGHVSQFGWVPPQWFLFDTAALIVIGVTAGIVLLWNQRRPQGDQGWREKCSPPSDLTYMSRRPDSPALSSPRRPATD